MKLLAKMILLIFSNIKFALLKIVYRKRLTYTMFSFARPSSNIILEGKTARISLGKMVDIKENNEIKANGGSIVIGNNCFINRNCMIVSMDRIEIGESTIIGPGVMIYDHDHRLNDREDYCTAAVNIGRNCWIGAGALILKGVSIGDNAVIAAGTIVTKDILENVVVRNKVEYIIKELPVK